MLCVFLAFTSPNNWSISSKSSLILQWFKIMCYVGLLHFYTLYDQTIPTNTCSVGYMSRDMTDHGNVWIPSCWLNYLTISGLIWYYLIVYKYCHINQWLATCMHSFRAVGEAYQHSFIKDQRTLSYQSNRELTWRL